MDSKTVKWIHTQLINQINDQCQHVERSVVGISKPLFYILSYSEFSLTDLIEDRERELMKCYGDTKLGES